MGIFNFSWNLGKAKPDGKLQGGTPFIYVNNWGISTDGNLDLTTTKGQYLAYIFNPVVRSIMDKRADMSLNGKIYIEKNGEESTSPQAKKLLELLKTPNGFQTSDEFRRSVWLNLDLFGECFILPFKLGFNEVKGFTVLENQNLQIMMDYTGYPLLATKTNFIKSIRYTVENEAGSFIKDLSEFIPELIVIRSTSDKSRPGRGISKLISIQNEVNKITVASIAQYELLRNYGALGFLSSNSKDGIGSGTMNPNQKKAFEDDYTEKYGLTFDKKKIILTPLDLKYVQMSLPLKDLMLNETIQSGVKAICEALGYKYELLSWSDNPTFDSGPTAEKAMYQNYIIPQSNMIYNSFDYLLNKDENVMVYFDHVESLQESEKQKAEVNQILANTYTTLVQGGLITPEQANVMLIENEIIQA